MRLGLFRLSDKGPSTPNPSQFDICPIQLASSPVLLAYISDVHWPGLIPSYGGQLAGTAELSDVLLPRLERAVAIWNYRSYI